MKILAMEMEIEGVKPEQYTPYLKAEAACVWEMYRDGIIRELYFRQDRSTAVLVLECAGDIDARQALAGLPLVQAGLIRFEVIPLIPYPGFARLFSK